MKLNEVEDPAAVLAVPEEDDVEALKHILQTYYDSIEDRYNRAESDEPAYEGVLRSGSLCQELIAQLNDQ